MTHLAPDVDPQRFREVLGHLPTGACIVTTIGADGAPVGLSCNSFTSVSLDPPLVSFCPARTSTTWPVMRPSGSFAVNVLSEDQDELCRRFAARGVDRFAQTPWRPSANGNPLLDGALAWLDCVIDAEHEAGDHTIVVAAVRELDAHEAARPLLFFRGRFGRLSVPT